MIDININLANTRIEKKLPYASRFFRGVKGTRLRSGGVTHTYTK